MLVRHASGDIFAKVIDFGIAKLEARVGPRRPGRTRRPAPAGRPATIVLGTTPYYCGHEGPSATCTRWR
jgi:hypothetical protein